MVMPDDPAIRSNRLNLLAPCCGNQARARRIFSQLAAKPAIEPGFAGHVAQGLARQGPVPRHLVLVMSTVIRLELAAAASGEFCRWQWECTSGAFSLFGGCCPRIAKRWEGRWAAISSSVLIPRWARL